MADADGEAASRSPFDFPRLAAREFDKIRQMVVDFQPLLRFRTLPAAYDEDLFEDAKDLSCTDQPVPQVDLRSVLNQKRRGVVLSASEEVLGVEVQACPVTSSAPEPGPLPRFRRRLSSASSVEEVAVVPKKVVVLDTINLADDSEPEPDTSSRDAKLPAFNFIGVGAPASAAIFSPAAALAADFSPAALLAAAEGHSAEAVEGASYHATLDDQWRPLELKRESAEPDETAEPVSTSSARGASLLPTPPQLRPALLPTPPPVCPVVYRDLSEVCTADYTEVKDSLQLTSVGPNLFPTNCASSPQVVKVCVSSDSKLELPGWCKVCQERFHSWTDYIEHRHHLHRPRSCFVCNQCGLNIPDKDRQSHDHLHWKGMHFMCKFCPSSFTKSKLLKVHITTYHRAIPAETAETAEPASTSPARGSVMPVTPSKPLLSTISTIRASSPQVVSACVPSESTRERPGWCKKCEEVFYSWKDYIEHRHQWHETRSSSACNQCGLNIGDNDREAHDYHHREVTHLMCRFCPARFAKPIGLMGHLSTTYHRAIPDVKKQLKKSLKAIKSSQ